ncbi:MAG TPA: Tm-1-like ATP-binding domain-containing protein, partial [Polyangia bacterium]|nr:Tm-1-like ATP-binding domain-containing protein [Polyangia bacterium]
AARALPLGVPKLIVSTVASGNTRAYVGTSDLALMYSVVDIAGVNSVSEQILGNAAAAMAGMARHYAAFRPAAGDRPCLGATMFGVTTPCVTEARHWLEEHGYEVLVFHATGVGGMSMEALMRSGHITGVLDVTTAELADEVAGGVLAAGPDRLEVAGELGLPQVVSLGGLDMINFGPMETVPERYRARNLYRHNPAVTLMRTTPEECAELGRIIAAKLNRAGGRPTLFIPRRGFSAIGTEGGVFRDAEADAALIRQLRASLDPSVEVVEMDTDINDPAFAHAMARRLHEHHQEWAARRRDATVAAGKEESAEAGAEVAGPPHTLTGS